MAEISEENLELVKRFVGLTVEIIIRQKAVELALSKLGLSEDDWELAMREATESIRAASFPEDGSAPLESYLETITTLLRNS